MGNGTRENPYTRDDVLKLIKENGDKTEGLDLSGKVFEGHIDLRQFNLQLIILKKAFLPGAHFEGARLVHATLDGAHLGFAHLEKADLGIAHLDGANLVGAYLDGANLQFATLDGAILWNTKFSPETRLEQADWGNYILGEERGGLLFDTAAAAADTYRRLKQWYTNAGMYDVAGKFFYREMEAKRKSQSWKRKPHLKLWNWVMRILCGYGEKPERVVVSALVIIFGLAIVYRFGGLSLPYSIYYSVVSFTALGYGSWVPQPTDWVKGLGVAEAVIGVFMMALFLVTFTRKMTR